LSTGSSRDRFTTDEEEGVYLGGSRTGEFKGKSGSLNEIPLERMRETPVKDAIEELDKTATEEREPFREQEKKLRLPLQVEAGDSQVALKWKSTDIKLSPGDPPLKFTIFYGSESGKYEKKLDVGATREHRLRGLINNQVYYVKVQGYSKDNSISVFSDEVKVIPLPDDEMGSLLEKSFFKSPVTLQDKKENLETAAFKRTLKQFGYDFFRNTAATAVPTDNLPVGDDYIIGPGDSLRIDMWGSISARYDLKVDRNGEITIPKVGVVKVWGLSFAQMKEAVNRAISRYFRGYELNVTLGRLRTIQVFVVGEVESPGMYNISSTGTVINALSTAGGPSKNGSLRTIKLIKSGKTVQDIDLYDMFLSGDRSKDIRLESGDTIFVPVVGPVVAVAGEVKRPAIYELNGKTSLGQLFTMAGGITAEGYIGRIQLERVDGNNAKIIIDYEQKGAKLDNSVLGVDVLDRDMVKVFPVNKALRQVVSLQGNVVRPGEYQFRSGMRVTDLITGYQDLLPNSWLESAEISRLALPDYHREVVAVNIGKALAGDAKENVLLQEQDSLQIFAKSDKEEKRSVAINGQVVAPGTYDFHPNMTVRDLIALAGNLKLNAFRDSGELTRIVVEDGRAKSIRIAINLDQAMADVAGQNLLLQPNDVLIVRSIVDWQEAKDRFVNLKGEVLYPGNYSITKGERLSSVIERAGGFTKNAYLKGAKFTRKSVQESQQKRMIEVIAKSEVDIMRRQAELSSVAASKEELEATRASLEGLLKSLEMLKNTTAEGRIVTQLAQLDEFKKSPYDIELAGGDALEIPQTPNVVHIMGQVYNPTTLIHMPQEDLSYYLLKAGGPTRDAEDKEMYVIRADGSVVSREQSTLGIRWDEGIKQWTFGSFMSTYLNPGDTLVVPQKIERVAWLRDIKDITTIMSQIALTAGTVLIGLK
jgi:protein involved in polysaccharide export with SLBB domain